MLTFLSATFFLDILLIDEWIMTICFIHTMGCYSPIRKNEIIKGADTMDAAGRNHTK